MLSAGESTTVRMLLSFVVALGALAAHPCGSCHPKQVSGYARTGMANSLARPKQQPAGSFTHPYSGSKFTIRFAASEMRQRLERNAIAAEYRIDYIIGSGNHAL